MTYVCSVCEVEKSKSHMATVGLNGSPPLCKACHSMVAAADEFVAMRAVTRILDMLRDEPARHRVLHYANTRFGVSP